LTVRFLFAKLFDIRPTTKGQLMALTKRQRQMYDFITEFVQSNGYSPSFEEIGAAMGLSSLATVHKHLNNLETKKMLRRDYNRSRSIDVLPLPEGIPSHAHQALASTLELPLVGRIAAGKPIEQVETPETISLTDFTRAKDVFVLQVVGDSMQDEHIMNGDYVLVEKTESAREGEIVVALLNGSETTLKRLYRAGKQIRLQPSNATMQPIMVPAESVRVQGRVVAVLRKY
jgi:repressor LexA